MYFVYVLVIVLKNKMWKMLLFLCFLVDLEVKFVFRFKYYVCSVNVKGVCDVDLWNRWSCYNFIVLIDCFFNLERF